MGKDFSEPARGITDDLSSETHRGCVLVAHGWIHELLGRVLRKKLMQLSNGDTTIVAELLDRSLASPLGAYAHRARMARALGLISKEMYAALCELNRLRVHFAHHPGIVTLTYERVEAIGKHLGIGAEYHGPKIHLIVNADSAIIANQRKYSQARAWFLQIVAKIRADLGEQF